MATNLFLDRINVLVRFDEVGPDLNDLEDYLIESFGKNNESGYVVNVSICGERKNEDQERLKQFCSVQGYSLYRVEEKFERTVEDMVEYKCDKCRVIANHVFINSNGGIYPCINCFREGNGPITYLSEFIDMEKKRVKTDKESEEFVKKYNEYQERISGYMAALIKCESDVCKYCHREYRKYNKIMEEVDNYNKEFILCGQSVDTT